VGDEDVSPKLVNENQPRWDLPPKEALIDVID
jgi:hypothetical protein